MSLTISTPDYYLAKLTDYAIATEVIDSIPPGRVQDSCRQQLERAKAAGSADKFNLYWIQLQRQLAQLLFLSAPPVFGLEKC